MISIRAESLTKLFPKQTRPSVDRLDFSIHEGESVAFLGPNGAGKSTTIKILCGILAPTSGKAELLGLPAGDIDANRQLGLVFGTRSQLYLHMTVAQCFDLSAEIYFVTGSQKKSRIAHLVERFSLGPLLNRRVRSLSLGERMRCEIVAALIHRPRVLLADEPTIGLDISAKNSLREMIRSWQRDEKTTLMLTSHDLSDVAALCDRCILIDQGTKQFDGPLENLKGESKPIRRIRVTTQNRESPLLPTRSQDPSSPFLLAKTESDYIHTYELSTTHTSMSEGIFKITQAYGDSVQDLSISEITLEEVLGNHYARAK